MAKHERPYRVPFHFSRTAKIGKSIDRKQIDGCQGSRGKGNWEVIANWYRASFWSNENVLELDGGDGCLTL